MPRAQYLHRPDADKHDPGQHALLVDELAAPAHTSGVIMMSPSLTGPGASSAPAAPQDIMMREKPSSTRYDSVI